MRRYISTTFKLWLTALFIAVSIFLLYLSILPDHLVTQNFGGDSGDLLSAILTNGIPHPTSYPTFMILGQLFQRFPLGSPYFRVALLSAVSMSMAVGLFYLWMVSEILINTRTSVWVAFVAGIVFGTAPLVWSQAVIVEVYSLQTLFLMLILWWLTLINRFNGTTKTIGLISLLSLLVGISAGNHITILLLVPTCIYYWILAIRKRVPIKYLGLWFFLIILGLSVYLYLPLSAVHYPPINWGNPQSWQGFIWEITGKAYQGLLFHISFAQLFARISFLARFLLDQVTIPGTVLGLVGVVFGSYLKPPLKWMLLWIFSIYMIFSTGYETADSIVYLIPTLLVFCVWIGVGLAELENLKWHSLNLGLLISLLLLLVVIIRIPYNRAQLDARKDLNAVSFAENYLKTAPLNAILLAYGDEDAFPLWYYHFGLGWRPDLRVIVIPLTQFVWYQQTLHHVYPDLILPPYEENPYISWEQEVPSLNPERPVCRSQADLDAPYGVLVQCPLQSP